MERKFKAVASVPLSVHLWMWCNWPTRLYGFKQPAYSP